MVQLIGYVYIAICLIIGCGSLIFNWFDEDSYRAKQQLRIVSIGSVLAIAPLILINVIPKIASATEIASPKYTIVSMVLLPLSFAYAILRYQVMDLQLYIRRGIV
jgi:membrane protein YdbS with pleckstrin-like domain